MATLTIVGAGMMGSALCVPLAERGHEVRLVGTPLDREIIDALQAQRPHPKMNVALPRAVQVFHVEQTDEALRGAQFVALGVSSAGMDWACQHVAPRITNEHAVFMITKGMRFDGSRLHVFPDVFEAALPEALRGVVRPAAVAGPCIAGELVRRVPTCVLLTGRDMAMLKRTAAVLRTNYYHVWPDLDVVGVEACAALKNAYAMGVAFAAGLHEKHGGPGGSVAMHNYESAVFAQALYEMRLIVRAVGGEVSSVGGLAGAGDLDVTNNGGRTGRFGRLLGLGLTVPEAIERMDGATLECLAILAQMREATGAMCARGELPAHSVPLFEHMAAVALDGEAVDMPFDRFFGAGAEPPS
jgi:glycerol-3-phosphate dehydrogenase (NAD(P)+)